MRVAFLSPMPPSPSGIADYSSALVEEMRRLTPCTVYSSAPKAGELSRHDIALYQIGNNGHHGFVYESAVRHPGVVVLHESNLHHLLTDITIRRGDWEGYLREVAFEGGQAALAHAEQVYKGIVGPDYEGVPILRRLVENSRGVIVHSGFVGEKVREAGFQGPLARIPHGVWFPDPDRNDWRRNLAIADGEILFGIFGHLKPYKRIREALYAFAPVARRHPRARIILVGEPHPDLRLDRLLEALGLAGQVKLTGRVPIEQFEGYLSACDALINLRYPTVGESSGTMMRAFGMAKPVIVSAAGAFEEFPDTVCLKAPVGEGEQEYLEEYLEMLVTQPDLRRKWGERARQWAAAECSWPKVAGDYVQFLERVAVGGANNGWWPAPMDAALPEGKTRPDRPPETQWAPAILDWCPDQDARSYADKHLARLERTLDLVPPGAPDRRILEMGAYLQITPLLKFGFGYGCVRGCYYGPLGTTESREVVSRSGERFSCDIDLFDAERDRFPYPDSFFHTILCCELLEHLHLDPMYMMNEINRILAPDGVLVLTTPNITSLRAIAAICGGYHPGFFPAYIRPAEDGSVDARHAREYTPREIYRLLEDSGFEVNSLDTGPFLHAGGNQHVWVEKLLNWHSIETEYRGECIFATGRKAGPPKERYPSWLYS